MKPPRKAARALKIASVAVGAIVAVIAIAANLGTAFEHACKYTKYCPETRPVEPVRTEPSDAKKDVIVVVCNGQVTKGKDGTVTCTTPAASDKRQTVPTGTPALQVPVLPQQRKPQVAGSGVYHGPGVAEKDCPDLKPFGVADPRPCDSALAREIHEVARRSGN
jgi:hypothetical protein